jgi:alpha-mannosidase
MKFQELLILLPCHSLEDFPTHNEGDEAAGLLAAWTALWHPAFIAAAGKLPSWARADDPPQELGQKLLVIPQVSEALLQAGWSQRAASEGACVVRKKIDRLEIAAAGLAALDSSPAIDEELVRDFFALGYAYLQEELLTRQMRYMSNLDETHFRNQTVAAAEAAAAGDAEKAHEHLQGCFDVLTEAREHAYPAEAYLVDLTLVAPTTLGAALRQELAAGSPTSLLVSGETLAAMAAQEPESLAALRAALQGNALTLAGGDLDEAELPLLPPETVLDSLRRSRELFQRHLGQAPEIYARRRFGLWPALPQLLSRCGFTGALHFTLDEGQFPRADQSKAAWEGLDSTTIPALTRVPLDVDAPETFLGLCRKVGDAMDHDFVATLTFAHWPGKSSQWYDDLRRLSRYAPVFGRFVTLAEYFRVTASASTASRFGADQYRTPYLKQAIIRRQEDPLSRVASAHRRDVLENCVGALRTLGSLLRGRIDGLANTLPESGDDSSWQQQVEAAARDLAAALPREQKPAEPGCLVFNPLSFARKIVVNVSGLPALPQVDDRVKAVQGGERKLALVEVPAMGYAWLAAGGAASGPAAKAKSASAKEPAMAVAGELLLRNEFFEVVVDPHTGAIRALHDYRKRGNQLSQQIALRQAGPKARPGDVWRDPDETAIYSVMAADSVEVTSAGPVLGEIVSRGRLVDQEGKRLAGFRQTVQVCRGSRVIVLDIELDVEQEPRADPWNSYYAARFAWPDETANLFRGVSGTRQPTDVKRLESPYFVEARAEKGALVFLTGGLPYHRRVGMRMLDTMLVVRGEQQRRFRLGIAVDHPQPLAAAAELLCPAVCVHETAPPPRGAPTGWLFHLDARNVLATRWQPLASAEGSVEGFGVRLLETDGRPAKAKLRCFRPPKSARHKNFAGETLTELTVQEDAVLIDFAAFEWVEVEARW